MVLFQDGVEIPHPSYGDGRLVLDIIVPDGRGIGPTASNRTCLRHPVTADRLGEETPRRVRVSVRGQKEVDGLARLVHGVIEVVPVPSHTNVGILLAKAWEKG
jgi:hypothetical protein